MATALGLEEMVENKLRAGQQIESIQMFIYKKKSLLAVASSGCVACKGQDTVRRGLF